MVRGSTSIAKLFWTCLVVTVLLAAAPAAIAACGNGVLETGEDCDDGSQNNGPNSCCTNDCKFSGESPDVVVGMLYGSTSTGGTLTNYGTSGGITAYSIGTKSCNRGTCWLNWISSTNEHPVIGQNMYRLKGGRFEQIGQSWLKHGFTALTENLCGSCIAPPSGSHLGVNCSDPYSASLNGQQNRLGPKWEVNPSTGEYPYPFGAGTGSGALYKRLQVHNTDLDPAQNAGALYFVEGQYVTRDDAAAKNNANNASYRRVTVGNSPFNVTLQDSTLEQQPGIRAWQDNDASVTEATLAASDGNFLLSAKATSLGGGIYHYEYAVQNLTSDRAGQSFSVPIPIGAVVTNVGFHDVDYHSGEPFSGTDWTPTVSASSVTWATQTHATNPNANALRWGTLYNFRFDANVPPGTSPVDLGLFKPGTPASVSVTTVTPGNCTGAANGTPCSDGDACTQTDTCQSGVCAGANPVVCTASDACHDAGTCSPATGTCSNPAKPNGSVCNDANGCTQTDTCQAGACTGSNPVVCVASDQCHNAGTCSPGTGACSNPAKANGSACNDANACTQTDTCQSGACAGANPVVCAATDQCHDVGTCSPATGACSNPAKANGSACNDANACTQTDTCQSGACAGSSPVVCAATDPCHDAGTCSPATGACSNPVKPDGSACSDADACTQTDTCQSGLCAGSNPVVCAATDQCHDAGTCSPATGACSNPALPDGTECSDADRCTQTDTCQSGACAGSSPVLCTATDPCHAAGACEPSTGFCSHPAAPDFTPCDDANSCTSNDVCNGGACAGVGPPAPLEVSDVAVSQSGGVTTITWTPAPGATSCDVLRGLVSALPVGPGGGDEVCLSDNVVGNFVTDAADPDLGETFWYLVQGENPCGKGPEGFESQNGVPTVPRTSTTCP